MLTYPCSYEGHLRVGYAVVLPGDDGALAVAQKLREFSLRHFHPGSRILEILAGYRLVDQAFLSWLVRRFMIISGPSGSVPVRSLLAPGCSSPSRRRLQQLGVQIVDWLGHSIKMSGGLSAVRP